jgi:hypothetical protein
MKKSLLILLLGVLSSIAFAATEDKQSIEHDTPVAHSAGKKLVKGTCCWVEHYLQNPIVFLTLIY